MHLFLMCNDNINGNNDVIIMITEKFLMSMKYRCEPPVSEHHLYEKQKKNQLKYAN